MRIKADNNFEFRFRIDGLHWVVSDDPLEPRPLELFMRHDDEPPLLARVMKCNKENTCDKEFKPLPPIGAINRIQPRVTMGKCKAFCGPAAMVKFKN